MDETRMRQLAAYLRHRNPELEPSTSRDVALHALQWMEDPDSSGVIVLNKMPPDTAPKGAPVLVAGGIAMRKTGGNWFTGMEEPAFQRELNWQPKWWSPIPQQND